MQGAFGGAAAPISSRRSRRGRLAASRSMHQPAGVVQQQQQHTGTARTATRTHEHSTHSSTHSSSPPFAAEPLVVHADCGGDTATAEPLLDFLSAYGCDAAAIAKLSASVPDLFQSQPDVYEVGRVLLFLHSLGWSHEQVMRRVLPLYPQLLTKHVDRDLAPVLAHLQELGCNDVRLFVWENVRCLCGSSSTDWRRHIRKLARLGQYGLQHKHLLQQQQQHTDQQQQQPASCMTSQEEAAERWERLMHHLQ